MDYIINPVADFLQWSFGILESLQNKANFAFIALGILGLMYWLRLQIKYNREAAADTSKIK